jgi:glycine betaine/proline transport system ATP-binding protein
VVTSPAGYYVREFVQDASPAKVLTAGGIMTEPDVIIYDWQGPKAALPLLKTSRSDHGFVVSKGRKYLGLVTEKRLSELIKGNGKTIKEILEPDIPACAPGTLMENLFCLAISTRFPIPVIDENGKLVGQIDNDTLLSSMVQYKEVETEDSAAEKMMDKEKTPDA